jgi:hypothetical protein
VDKRRSGNRANLTLSKFEGVPPPWGQDNANNADPIEAEFRLDAGFGTYENVTLLIEMGYEVYTKPHSHQVVRHLKSPAPMRGNDKRLWIDPVTLMALLNGWALAQWAMQISRRLQFWALPKPTGPGAPKMCQDESMLLTSLVAAAWRLSLDRITEWLTRYEALAEVLGYHKFDPAGRRRTISLAQYSRRLRELSATRLGDFRPLCACLCQHVTN